MIVFTKHAQEKFLVLKRHGVTVTKDDVINAIQTPGLIDYSRLPLLIVQAAFDNAHVLRVVYKVEENLIKIITFYPGRKKQYGQKTRNK